MERLLIVAISILGISLFQVQLSYPDSPGETCATFLKIGIGARANALGGAYCALSSDPTGIYWNPAGLIQIKGGQLSCMYNMWFQDIKQEFLAYAQPIGKRVIGLSFTALQIDGIEKRLTDTPNYTKTRAQDLVGIVSYAEKPWNNISIGGSFKLIRQEIDGIQSDLSYAVDLGGLYKASRFSLGLCAQNVGRGLKFKKEEGKLPLNIKFGMAYRLLKDNLILAMDINKSIDNKVNFHLGFEWSIAEVLSLRCGYKYPVSLGSGVSGGLGFKIGGCQLDYAWVPYGDLGDTHRISLSLKFAGKEKPKIEEKDKGISKEIIAKERRGRSDNLELIAQQFEHPDYTRVYVNIKNISNKEIYISPLYFSIITRDGKRIESSDKTFTDKEHLAGKTLLPNEENKGILIFDTKEPLKRLEYKDAIGNFLSIDFSP